MLGEGVEKDYDAALRLARRAADKGNAVGECIMGILFANGWGVPQDYREAARWYAKSAAQGDEDAIWHLRALDALAHSKPRGAAGGLRRCRGEAALLVL